MSEALLLDELILRDKPGTVLLVAEAPPAGITQALDGRVEQLSSCPPQQLGRHVAELGRQALLLFHGCLDNCARDEVARLLAAARDVYAERTLVMSACDPLDETLPLSRNFMFSMGFQYLGGAGEANFNLYEYSILNYKTVPDWLNARFWANPENWDKFRW
ncbi:DUF6231 family protein [Granulosicoccaceae sp. 1_MG-2023]|nr:DUF6231 family protein [Granulosicoccaceae sp. 1_MG-2023]